jgi:hypothetical protein
MLRRGGEHPEAGMVKHPGCRRIAAWRDVGAGLLIQPPAGQAKLSRYGQCLVMDDAVRFKQCIHVAGSPPGVEGESHGSAAEHVKVRDYAPLGEPLAKAPESILDACPIEQWRGFTHAASIS